MNLGKPYLLFLLVLVPVAIVYLQLARKHRKNLLAKFCTLKMARRLIPLASEKRRLTKEGILIAALGLMAFSLAQPQCGYKLEPVRKKGIELIVALDTSKSMLAMDVAPSRLERAKTELKELVGELEGDKIALVAFAGESYVQCPMTLDYRAMDLFIGKINTDLIPVKGTAIGRALVRSLDLFKAMEQHSKAIVLITDGEETADSKPLEVAKRAKAMGVRIFAIGIGSGEPVPMPADEGQKELKRDAGGNLILSSLDEALLKSLVDETGGSYIRSQTGELNFKDLLSEVKEKTVPKELRGTRIKRWEDRFQGILFVALCLLGLEVLIGEMKGERIIGGLRDVKDTIMGYFTRSANG